LAPKSSAAATGITTTCRKVCSVKMMRHTIKKQRLIAIARMSGKAGKGIIRNPWYWSMVDRRKRKQQKHEEMLITPPPDWREYFDHYLGRRTCLVDIQHALLSLEQFFPCQLIFAALCVHAQRLRQPSPPLPRYMQVRFPALQLQRFLRGCVLVTARSLVIPPSNVFHLVHTRVKSRWIDRIFVRVMSGFARRAQVRRMSCCSRAFLAPSLYRYISQKTLKGIRVQQRATLRLRLRCFMPLSPSFLTPSSYSE
jgi:hypothetical protein